MRHSPKQGSDFPKWHTAIYPPALPPPLFNVLKWNHFSVSLVRCLALTPSPPVFLVAVPTEGLKTQKYFDELRLTYISELNRLISDSRTANGAQRFSQLTQLMDSLQPVCQLFDILDIQFALYYRTALSFTRAQKITFPYCNSIKPFCWLCIHFAVVRCTWRIDYLHMHTNFRGKIILFLCTPELDEKKCAICVWSLSPQPKI